MARTEVTEEARISRIHLRMGQLTLARAELEDLYRRDALDMDGLASLAEARWRTGDGPGAADAALLHLDDGGADEVALCIAVEAISAEARPQDARALIERLPAHDVATLDGLFAGMPRRAHWPAGPVDREDPEELRRESTGGVAMRRGTPASGRAGDESPSQLHRLASAAPGPARQGHFDPVAELARGREELGPKPERALLRLALVLRHDPTLAPAVLDALHLRREPAAALLRGDAQRLLGRHLEAEAAFDVAADSLEVP